MGDDSCSKGLGFESRRSILDGYLFTLICCKNCIVCLKRQNKQKETGVAHFYLVKINKFEWCRKQLL